VSETPLPPPGGSIPTPPPELTAPPGYQGYRASPMGAVPLKRVGAAGTIASVFVAVTATMSVLTVLLARAARSDAQAFLDGETTRDDFLQSIVPYVLLGLLQTLALVASAVMVMVWMYQLASNLRTLGRGTTWGPGWAIGGWFAPPFVYVIPFLALREMWRASDPDVPIGGEWRRRPASPLVTAWFVVFVPVQIALQLTQLDDGFSALGESEEALAEQITGSLLIPSLAAASDVVAAVLMVLVIRGVTGRHRRLTGEVR
jgi:hypothetical protein